MSSRVRKIDSDQQFYEILSRCSRTQLIVIDFFAVWCGPCRMIAPKLDELSTKYVIVNFLKVDVDKCVSVAQKYGIQAMPTFVFLKNDTKLDEMRGANPHKLEEIIARWAGTADELEPSLERVEQGKSFTCFKDMITNDQDLFQSAGNLIVKIANNILKDPFNIKFRQIRLANEKFMNKLLPASGAVDCLFAMGFEEMDDRLTLTSSTSLDNLFVIRDTLKDALAKSNVTKPKDLPKKTNNIATGNAITCQKKLRYQFHGGSINERVFFSRIKSTTEQVLLYEEPELQQLALSKIPVEKLKKQAEKDSESSKDEHGTITVSQQDCLLLLLLAWFKKEFFTWTNSPACWKCGNQTVATGSGEPLPEERLWDAGIVECYRCTSCSEPNRFPRYNHPQKLLETRTGRCGEWANCFTLCCRAVEFDTRYVLDWTDHVWTEVYSEHQGRWLHCDPCENICDKPLVYETGWKKNLSYILAFSKSEVVDVSWRYSKDHKQLLHRREKVAENWLLDMCQNITKELQQEITTEDKKKLMMRSLVESVEFLSPKKTISSEEQEGRISGSLAWRQLRGETDVKKEEEISGGNVFRPSNENCKEKRMRVRYCPVEDCYYETLSDNFEGNKIKGWQKGVFENENIFRKVEHDWKMVYIARKEGADHAHISWKFDISETDHVIDHVTVKISSKCYENGKIVKTLCDDNKCVVLENQDNEISEFCGATAITLSANLKGGKGDVAWQHTQLFRCSLDKKEFVGFDIIINLKKKIMTKSEF